MLDARELVKGRVLESAMMSAREVCDAICEQTGAEGIQVVGNKFVIYRKSEKLERERKAQAQPKTPKPAKKKVNPVKAGIRSRRKAAKEERERRDKYFHDAAVQAAIERRKQHRRTSGCRRALRTRRRGCGWCSSLRRTRRGWRSAISSFGAAARAIPWILCGNSTHNIRRTNFFC